MPNTTITLRHFSLLLLALTTLAPMTANAQALYDGVLFSRGNKADAYPSHFQEGSLQRIYFCGTSSLSPAGKNIDGIFRISKSGSLLPVGGWSSSPTEVLNHSTIAWATHHVCDPTVVRGNFEYGGTTYQYALYFTADDGSTAVGVNGAIGLALSNDGLSWVALTSPIVLPANGFNGSYGAGAQGVAAVTYTYPPTWAMVYQDTSLGYKLYLRSSVDGISWPGSPLDSHITDTLPGASAPDIAYNAHDCKWYVSVNTFTATEGIVTILKANNPNDLDGPWSVIGSFGLASTGQVSNHNPGLARDAAGNLLVDASGFGYVFLSVGPAAAPGSPFPDWRKIDLAQGRFPAGTFGLCPR